jgi:hypothetical protein
MGTHDKISLAKETTLKILNSLKHLTSSMDSQLNTSQMYQDALEIVDKAAELDGIFRTSKADFQVFITRLKLPLVVPPGFAFAFDPKTMECIKNITLPNTGNATRTVDLAVAPGIFKAGNSDGVNYESERVLVKLRALCNLNATLECIFEEDDVTDEGGDGEQPGAPAEDIYIKCEPGEDDDVDMLRPPY